MDSQRQDHPKGPVTPDATNAVFWLGADGLFEYIDG